MAEKYITWGKIKQEKKFLCVGGFVLTKTKEFVYVEAKSLPKLYGVNPEECEFNDFYDTKKICINQREEKIKDGKTILYPRIASI